MKLAPMRFMGYTWHHNPKKIEIISDKKVVSYSTPHKSDTVTSFGEKPFSVRGVGELYGNDCLKQYDKLFKLYKSGENGILCLPKLAPFYACFEKLVIVSSDVPDVLVYEFEFKKTKEKPNSESFFEYYTVGEDETLFDVAAKCGVDIEKLCELNSDIMFINDLKAGEQVRIC